MKKIKMTIQQLLLAGIVLVMGLTACQKENSADTELTREETENLTMASSEDAVSDLIFTEIHEQELGVMDDIGMPGIGLNDEAIGLDSANRCMKVTITPRDPGVFPKTIVFDYGTGCPGRDGKIRKGKMITVYSNPLIIPGATATTGFDGFYVDGIKVQGRHITKNNSTTNVRIFTRTVQDGKLTFPDNKGIAIWNATHTNKQIGGLGTPGFPMDDEFEITGGGRGVFESASNRLEWSRNIVEPLFKAFRCRWISKGVVHIVRNNNRAILNFGDGTCDNKAVIIINGERKEITL
jgi:hypothetical protein